MPAPFTQPKPFPAERVLIGITGSVIASTVIPGITWMRYALGIKHVRVILSSQAAQMIVPDTVAAHSNGPVISSWGDDAGTLTPHVDWPAWSDVFVVMPATANVIGKVANGIADTLLTTAVMASEGPVIFAPNMNPKMWSKAALQRNVRQLKDDGYYVIPPVEGRTLATNEAAVGSMPNVAMLMQNVGRILSSIQAEAPASSKPPTDNEAPAPPAVLTNETS